MEEKIEYARLKRSTAKTDANEVSSRSHAIFHIKIVSTQIEKKKPKTITGTITIVDLAGSERLTHSNTEGDRLNETKAINRSLNSLRDVISALYKKEQHIPYRNSKLTTILQNYLGKDSKTLVIINVSPCASHMTQTLGSLKFGDQLKQCTTGISFKPKPQVQVPAINRNENSQMKLQHSNVKNITNRMNSGIKFANPLTQLAIRRNLEEHSNSQVFTHREGVSENPNLLNSPKFE